MNATGAIPATMRTAAVAIAIAGALLAGARANAASAVYYSSTPYGPSMTTALSTAGDGAGPLVSLNEWISLLFSTPFGTSKSDTISIFTLPPTIGDARLTISFGSYNSGAPTFVWSRTLDAGTSLTVNNLAQRGCEALGGCDYIFIQTTRQRNGAAGVSLDYVSVNGEPTEVTEPTPEPSVWALMILGFGGAAWRLKASRRRNGAYSFSSA